MLLVERKYEPTAVRSLLLRSSGSVESKNGALKWRLGACERVRNGESWMSVLVPPVLRKPNFFSEYLISAKRFEVMMPL